MFLTPLHEEAAQWIALHGSAVNAQAGRLVPGKNPRSELENERKYPMDWAAAAAP